MSLKLYFDLMSQPSRALYIFLKTCNIPFVPKSVRIQHLEHLSEDYEKINPFKKLPAIQHNGLNFTESVAILRYLSREFKVADHWYPKSSQEQARVDEFLEWQHLNTRLYCARYFLYKVVNPMLKGKEPDPAKVMVYEKEMSNNLDLIESVWLKDRLYLTGSKISVADIIGACEIEQPRMGGYDPRKGRPQLSAWLDRVANETSPYYQEAHTILNKVANKQQAISGTKSML